MKKDLISQLNIVSQCRKYGVPLWQCPQFLFLGMGVVIIISSITTYFLGVFYKGDPGLVALIDIILTSVLFIISFIVTKSFERIAEASRMKSEFIDIVSHQLRSPLTNIRWIVDFLTSDGVIISKEKKEEYFDHLLKNVDRMADLVNQLLIVSKIEQKTFPLRKKEGSLEELVLGLIDNIKPFALASGVEIKFYPPKDFPKLLFDPTMIKMVIENLLDNAIRYSKKGGKIEIHLEKKEKEILFKIKDSGIGIPQKDQKYIFQKFYRGENSAKKKTKGSGLGLYICKLIIEKSGGKIWFKSEEGKGTTFFFTLPLR